MWFLLGLVLAFWNHGPKHAMNMLPTKKLPWSHSGNGLPGPLASGRHENILTSF